MIVENQVVKINLSERVTLENSVPMLVTEYDFEEALFIEGEVFGETKRYSVDHDATIIEADGTELRIAPRDVQYQSASVLGKILTNFAGPLNNFILGIIAFIIITFMQGGVPSNTNQIGQVQSGTPAYSAGLQSKDKIQAVNGEKPITGKKLSKGSVQMMAVKSSWISNVQVRRRHWSSSQKN